MFHSHNPSHKGLTIICLQKIKKENIVGQTLLREHIEITSEVIIPWASYQKRKIVGCACAGIAVNVSPATDFKGNR